MIIKFRRMAAAAITLVVLSLPAHSAVVPGQLLGIFSGNDSVAGLFNNLGLEATRLARIDLPSAMASSTLSDDGLTISNFALNGSDEVLLGQWSYSGPEIANIIVLKAGRQYAVYLFSDAITTNMPNIGLFDTSDLHGKGLSHITAYSVSVVPVPAAVWLFASGLIGLACARRKV